MFSSRKPLDADSALAKFQDGKRDSLRRLRSLHTAHDLATSDQMKVVYKEHFSLIYYLFHVSFTTLESSLKPKGGRARQLSETQQEELYDVVLLTLERVLIYNPDQVQRRWQANSMGLIIRKLLHQDNQIKLRKKAVQLVLLWLQDLQTNASADILELFASIVPGVNNASLSESTEPSCKPTAVLHVPLEEHDPVLRPEIFPILPAVESSNDGITRELMQCILQGITYEFQRILWDSVDQRIRGFVYLFEQFKTFYIKPLFPNIDQTPSIYNQTADPPILSSRPQSPPSLPFSVHHELQDMIIRWLLDQLIARKLPGTLSAVRSDGSQVLSSNMSNPSSPELSEATFGFLLEGDLSVLSREQQETNARRFIRQVLFSKKDNVDLVHCVFREGFHLPLTHLGTIKKLVMLYQTWIKEPTARPLFMNEPEGGNNVTDCPSSEKTPSTGSQRQTSTPSVASPAQSLAPVQEDDEQIAIGTESEQQSLCSVTEATPAFEAVENSDSEVEKSSVHTSEAVDLTAELETELTVSEAEDDHQLADLSSSYQMDETNEEEEEAIAAAVIDMTSTQLSSKPKRGWVEDVRAGMQNNLRLFVTNVASVFTVRAPAEFLDHQVDLSTHVLNFLQTLARDVILNQRTWEHMLTTLLHITQTVLRTYSPESPRESLGSKMASSILRTLFVSWVRANLFVRVSTTLWNDMLQVLSQQTHWIQVVQEWKKIMVILTRLLAKHLYGLEMNSLPLDVLKQSAHRAIEKRSKETSSRQISQTDKPKRASFVTGLDDVGPEKPVQIQQQQQQKPSALQTALPKQSGEDSILSSARQAVRRVRRNKEVKATEQQRDQPVKLRSSSATEAELLAVIPSEVIVNRHSNISPFDSPPKRSSGAGVLLQRSITISHPGASEIPRPTVERRNLSSTPSSEDEPDKPPDKLPVRRLISLARMDVEQLQRLNQNTLSDTATESAKQEEKRLWFSDSASKTIDVGVRWNQNTLSDTATESAKQEEKRLWFSDSASKTIDVGVLGRDNELIVARQQSSRAKSEGNVGQDVPDIGETRNSMLQTALESGRSLLSHERQSSRQVSTVPPGDSDDHSTGECMGGSESGFNADPPRSHTSSKSVITGGTKRGWTDVSSAILWRQMMGILGNVNSIKQPHIHCEAMKCLAEVWESLYKIKQNQGVVLDDGLPATEVEYSPPLFAIAPLVFQAAGMPEEYKSGRLVAYRLMCDMTVKRHDVPPTSEYLDHFYRLMRAGLRSQDQDFLAAIVFHSYKIFSLPLPGVTGITADYIDAAGHILSSPEVSREVPRLPALAATGSLLFFPRLYRGVCIEGSSDNDGLIPLTFETVQNKLIALFIQSAKDEKSRNARCLAISVLGTFVFSEFAHQTAHPKLNESLQVILSSLLFREKVVALVTIDVVRLLSGVINAMMDYLPSLPALIVEIVAYTISLLLITTSGDEMEQRTIVAMLTCLLDWFMLLPLNVASMPTEAETGKTVRGIVLEVFAAAATNSLVSFNAKANRQLLLSRMSSSPTASLPSAFLSTRSRQPSDSPPRSAPPDSTMKSFKFPARTSDVVKLTARSCLSRLSVLYGHYPFVCGASRISCLLSERDDNPTCMTATDIELPDALFNSPNVQFFSYQNNTILTVIELPVENNVRECRVITRDATGKFAWDSRLLHSTAALPTKTYAGIASGLNDQLAVSRPDRRSSQKTIGLSRSAPHIPDPFVLPTHETVITPDADLLDRLLVHIGTTSPECVADPEHRLNAPDAPPDAFNNDAEFSLIDALHAQDYDEKDNYAESQKEMVMLAEEACPLEYKDPLSPFYHCQLLLNYMGLLSWEQRSELELLKKQDGLLRELKHLDQRQCRETHKIAVLYVGHGQEDKQSIMANSRGSQLFEEFVSGLAWEINLGNHPGFMGGLQRNQTTGSTAPYYATSTVEVIFHVATRFPVDEDGTQWLLNKVRHLGNDEIQIVWSEHTGDYRREIIKTQFGDVYIVIYPLHNTLFRIQIIKKPDVPFFGPLFDGAIVDMLTLPHLVRETALNASRAKRSQLSYYQQYFEDRTKYLENTIKKLRLETTFEEFMTRVVRPAPFLSDQGSVPDVTITVSKQEDDENPDRSQWSPLASSEDETDRGQLRGRRANTFTQGDRTRYPSPLQRLGKFFERGEQLSLPDSLNTTGKSSSPRSKHSNSSDKIKKGQ